MAPHDKQPRGEIEWFTVRYRTIVLGGLALLVAAVGWLLFLRPRPAPPPSAQPEVQTGARFSVIEGSVQVKRAGTLEWLPASRATVLRQNDLVRTGPSGAAEIRFEDGFMFSVRPDSLITVEESTQNTVSREQRVGLSIQSGEANFQTPARGVPGRAAPRRSVSRTASCSACGPTA